MNITVTCASRQYPAGRLNGLRVTAVSASSTASARGRHPPGSQSRRHHLA